ncbi:beta-1,4 N-acetylgalactosaminyltransferase 1 isoform X1 [Xenopus laevis]|uniref:Beta-1,4 N-acetylgalactosaminyltransferase n=3 Tax=Xenopus laevis TaxID=8355 RepID=A0A8J1MF74_XENLA|nr:beta-1,4 N-acetylgalactosaminyltransferase 1 isoform X1 [Xenopus laevis]
MKWNALKKLESASVRDKGIKSFICKRHRASRSSRSIMRLSRKLCAALVVTVPLSLLCFHIFTKPASVVNVWNREAPKYLLDPSVFQPSEKLAHIPFKWKEDVLQLLPKNSCKCEAEATLNIPFRQELFGKPYAIDFTSAIDESELDETKKRREQEFKKYNMRYHNPTDRLIIAKANSPLQYPTQGVEVHPLKTIIIPGLSLQDFLKKVYKVSMSSSMGTFNTAAEVEGVTVKGAGEGRITLSSPNMDNLNRQLQFISYTNTIFNPNTADIVKLQTDEHSATFHIKIRHPRIPRLYDSGSSNSKYNISTLVTIATKTFLRYDKLQNLIDSIRKYYPTVPIIIADDSEKPQKVEGPFIEQYIMPFGKGWFAGRNLAISQVTTKYVLWVDDDFIFSPRTKIEKLVDILEKTTLDLVGGSVREITGYYTTYRQKITVFPGGKEGDCLMTHQGYHHAIEGFPNCVVTDGVVNFFLARTEKALQVGFDPRLSRIGHLEFFIDGLGILHIGSCDDVIVDHASKIQLPWSKTETDKEYAKFRYPKSSDNGANVNQILYYFKNRFKCATGN